jgi:hypothetical protein
VNLVQPDRKVLKATSVLQARQVLRLQVLQDLLATQVQLAQLDPRVTSVSLRSLLRHLHLLLISATLGSTLQQARSSSITTAIGLSQRQVTKATLAQQVQ